MAKDLIIVKTMLKKSSYKLCHGKLLVKACQMVRLIGRGRLQNVLFTDKRIFTVQRGHDHQINRKLLGKGSQKLLTAKSISRSHLPSSVMVLGSICFF